MEITTQFISDLQVCTKEYNADHLEADGKQCAIAFTVSPNHFSERSIQIVGFMCGIESARNCESIQIDCIDDAGNVTIPLAWITNVRATQYC